MYGSALTALLKFLMLVVCGSYLETDSGVPIALSLKPSFPVIQILDM